MRNLLSAAIFLIFLLSVSACSPAPTISPGSTSSSTTSAFNRDSLRNDGHPRIASWLAKKDEIIASQKPYALVMSGWFTPEEASQIKAVSPKALLLAGLSVNWVYDNSAWMTFLTTVANYGQTAPVAINEGMYLHDSSGKRIAFGWASTAWEQEEIYAMDPQNPDWIKLITSFYKNTLAQPQHDGIIVDMVTEKSWNTGIISDQAWQEATRKIMAEIQKINTQDKLVVFNSGKDFSEIAAYAEFTDGFLMENCLGSQFGASFDEAFKAADNGKLVVYAVDTDDTGQQDLSRMRLGLVLSLLHDNTYFTYDFGSRDHGQAWWYREYDVDLGEPLGAYYQKDNALYRDFEKGIVVAAPYSDTIVSLNKDYTDITTGIKASVFQVAKGDAGIYLEPPATFR
jgi:hypothetical protein